MLVSVLGFVLGLALLGTAPASAQPTPPPPSPLPAGQWAPSTQTAQVPDDPPGRVGRLVVLQGESWLYDQQTREWIARPHNWPVTSGDRVRTEPEARVEVHVGSTTLRLGGSAELIVQRLDDSQLDVQLDTGSLALRLAEPAEVGRVSITTPEGRWTPRLVGHYRIDRLNEASQATVWRGELWFDSADTRLVVVGARRLDVWLQGPRLAVQYRWAESARDDFAEWVQRDEQVLARSQAAQYVSPEMTGWQDLDRHGNWVSDAEYGGLWLPTTVAAGWAPYRYGQWAWVAPWGWTWVDAAPWGFAPFHYGRWVMWRGRWAWSPGHRVPRPVYAPALVAWIGGPAAGIGVKIGGPIVGRPPLVGWVPLAPWEPYRPHYAAGERHRHDVNLPQRREGPPVGGRPSEPRPGTPEVPSHVAPGVPPKFANQAVPGAVTLMPGNAFGPRRPVAPSTGSTGSTEFAPGRAPAGQPPAAAAMLPATSPPAAPQPVPRQPRPPGPPAPHTPPAPPTPQAPQVTQLPQAPLVPQVTQLPRAPQTPQAPQMPQMPQMPPQASQRPIQPPLPAVAVPAPVRQPAPAAALPAVLPAALPPAAPLQQAPSAAAGLRQPEPAAQPHPRDRPRDKAGDKAGEKSADKAGEKPGDAAREPEGRQRTPESRQDMRDRQNVR